MQYEQLNTIGSIQKKSVSFFAVGGGDSVTNGKMQERELEGIDTQNRKVVDDLFYHDRKCKNNVGRVEEVAVPVWQMVFLPKPHNTWQFSRNP